MTLLKVLVVLGVMTFVKLSTVPATPTQGVCDICKEMVAEARASLVSNLTVNEMKQVFEGTCRILVPVKSLANLCLKYADELVPELIDTLAQEMDPTRVCVTSGLCQADSFTKVLASVKKIGQSFSLRASQVFAKHDPGNFVKMAESIEFSDQRAKNLLKGMCYLLPGRNHSGECADAVNLYYPIVKTVFFTTVKNTNDCQLCEMVVQFAENEITSTAIDQDIVKFLLPLCDHVGSYKSECKAFIMQYVPQLLKLIISQVKSKTLCTDIGLCSTVKATKVVDVLEVRPIKSDECTICKALVTEAKVELLSDEYVSFAKSAVIKLCDICPVKSKCSAYMNTNFAKFYKEFVGMIDPTMTCVDLGVCHESKNKLVHVSGEDTNVITFENTPEKVKEPVLHRISLKKEINNVRNFPVLIRPSEKNVLECTTCKYLFHYIQEELVKKESITNLESVLHKVCQKLPEISSECDSFIDKYTPTMAALIAQEVDPSYICYKVIDVCSAQDEIAPKTQIKSIKWNECSVCILAVGYLGELLQNNDLDTDLTKIMEQVCQLIPKSAHDECLAFISTYGPSAIHLLGDMTNSKKICQEITLCPKSGVLLGKDKCSYGPAYWCKDVGTAHMCNAFAHCSRVVWRKPFQQV